VTVTNALTLPTVGSVTINLTDLGGLSGIEPLFTYGNLGNSFSSSQLALAATVPYGAGAYAFRSTGDTANPGEIDVIAPTKLTWSGSGSNVWDTNNTGSFTALNLAGTSVFNANYGTYGVKDHVVFDDSGSTGAVAIAPAGVTPLEVIFKNNAESYTLTGGSIMGSTSLVLSGTGTVTLDNANSYTGGTYVTSGDLVVENSNGIRSSTNLYVGKALSDFPVAVPQFSAGFSPAGATAVPEPGTFVLMAAAALLYGCRFLRRRKA
jgi:autotransporter-associated beta strand protein